ncbi:MAG: cytochrome c biogenesis protein ResB [Verrucomicrobiota bacterium]
MNSIFKFFSSLKLTVWLLSLSIVLVFFGTLDQVHWGIHETQRRYFESFIVFWQYPLEWPGGIQLRWIHLPLPGGFTLGVLLLINLGCAHFRYFKATWKRTGIAITHLGVVLLLISGFLVSFLQQESQMAIDEGSSSNYSRDFRDNELVIINRADPEFDEVTAIPQSVLEREGSVELADLGLTVNVIDFMPNAVLGNRAQNPNAPPPRADSGAAGRMGLFAQERPVIYSEDEVNTATAIVELVGPEGRLGSWLVSNLMDEGRFPPQTFELGGQSYELFLRFKRTYLPFALELVDFTHDKYPGTEIPRNFSSDVRILTPGDPEQRPALIYMNHPLRHGGYTFYQASFGNNETTTILQVVRNPSWQLPYLAVLLVGLGMTIQFLMHLVNFATKRTKSISAPRANAAPTLGNKPAQKRPESKPAKEPTVV